MALVTMNRPAEMNPLDWDTVHRLDRVFGDQSGRFQDWGRLQQAQSCSVEAKAGQSSLHDLLRVYALTRPLGCTSCHH